MMDWELVVLVLTLTVGGLAQGDPQVTTGSGQIIEEKTGGDVTMTCRVQDLGSSKVNWIFVKHSLTIFHGLKKLADDNRYSLERPDSSVYTLLIRDITEMDQGVYKCEIEGTTKAATFQLEVTDSPVPPKVDYTPDQLFNRTGCCQQQGVSEQCLPLCASTSDGSNPVIPDSCVDDLPEFIYCGSDGRNHENCCAREGVPSECLMLCSNDPLQVPNITSDQLVCLNYFQSIVSCYQYGAALVPSPPLSLSVLPAMQDGQSQLLISWTKPMYNPSAVTGYIVMYKNTSESKFKPSRRLEPSVMQFTLLTEVNAKYSIYVVAVGHHGSSQASETVTIIAEDIVAESPIVPCVREINLCPSSTAASVKPGVEDIDICCGVRKVKEQCVTALCVPHLWDTFDTNAMLECYEFLPDIFACLADERDHTTCCSNNHVPDECLPMCSGSPPPFNHSLAICLPKLPVIEACVQQGLSTQPPAPTGIYLESVTAHSATVSWADPSVTGREPVDVYHVQLKRGSEDALPSSMEVVGTSVELTNLTETELYIVQVIAQIGNLSSLPSAAIKFATPPETTPTFRPTVDHNLTKCCEDSGMPAVCSQGCVYAPNMTAYYAKVLKTCAPFIGSVLTCAADGRDHTPCCMQKDVQEICYGMCVLNKPGPLNPDFIACLNDTAKIVTCFDEGLEDLVRMPENVVVTNITSYTLTVQWNNPETGPSPDKYELQYTSESQPVKRTTTDLVMVLQNLSPNIEYEITVTSFLNQSTSPPTQALTVFTTEVGIDSPYIPKLPTNISRALWNNRTHCCESSGIKKECQALCLNQPSNATDCSTEDLKILACATDGQDHSACCREEGLVEECVSLCGGHTFSNFTVRQAGCLAVDSLNIITSCFLANTGLLPAMPKNFRVMNGDRKVTLEWDEAENCAGACSYDVHFWRTHTDDASDYITLSDVSSPYAVSGLDIGGKYTFTVTARVVKGSGPAAPWQTVYFGIMRPEIYIAQRPATPDSIFEQGDDVTLICEIINFPHQVSFSWFHRGRLLDIRDRILLVDDVRRQREGNYTCTASLADFTFKNSTFVNVRYMPEVNEHRVDSPSPNVGAEAVVEFSFWGHPVTDNLAMVWSKDGDSVKQSSRYHLSAHTYLDRGITSFKLKIDRVVESDYGLYKCQVKNQYGSTVGVARLMDPDEYPTPIPPSPEQKQNMTRCCNAKGVPELCMPICRMEVSVTEAVDRPEEYGYCLFFFDELIECAADGADHTLCCEKENVHEDCLPLCKGQVPPTEDISNAPHLRKCVPEAVPILDCMETGYGKIPTAPLNFMAKVTGGKDKKIVITWTKPERNADRVTSYTVYYNHTGHSQYKMETITSLVGYSHELTSVMPGTTYNIWMTADNQNVGRSQATAMLSVSVEKEEEKEELSGGAIAGIVIGVVALVAIIGMVAYLIRRNNGKQKLMESVRFENAGYDNAVHVGKGTGVNYDKF